ncbi:MAG: hypothetical protein J3R72DRAFT_456480, partial [Linnemannia gamsii]
MYARNLIAIVLAALCTLCSFTSFVYAASDILDVIEPTLAAVNHVADKITVRVSLPGGESNILYKDNISIKLSIQKLISMPNLNVILDNVPARTLATTGYEFVALKEYIIDSQVNIDWGIRASFKHPSRDGYSDSRGFKIV